MERNRDISFELDNLRDMHSTCDEYMEELINKQNELKSLTQKLKEKEDECTALVGTISFFLWIIFNSLEGWFHERMVILYTRCYLLS